MSCRSASSTVVALLIVLPLALGLVACGGGGAATTPTAQGGAWPSVAPDGLVLAPGAKRLEIAWNPVPGATAYGVYVATASGVQPATYWSLPEHRFVLVPGSTTVSLEDLAEGATYWCVVTARTDFGEGPACPAAQATLCPGAPSGVTFTATDTGARLSWTMTRGAATYDAYVANDPNVSSTNIGALPGGRAFLGVSPPFLVTDLGVGVHAVVVARNGAGQSPDSPVASVTLGAPATLRFTPGNSAATLEWSDVPGATAYDLYIAEDPALTSAGFAALRRGQCFPDAASPFFVPGLPNGQKVYALVVARNDVLTSPDSALVSVTPSGRGTFIDNGSVWAGDGPQGTVTADLNGDGILDLAVTNRGDDTVAVLLGKGYGTFSHAAFHTVGGGPVAIVAADLNGDGALDLATADETGGTASVLLADGAGGFAEASSWSVGASPVCIHALPLGSPHAALDLVVVNRDDALVTVLPGIGDGTFDERAVSSYATGRAPQHAVSGDFDADGVVDLVTVDAGDGTVSFLGGDGQGGFRSPVASETYGAPTALVAAHLDADGLLDLLVLDESAQTLLPLLGRGDGTFESLEAIDAGTPPADAVVADFDGDGALDVAVTSRDARGVVVFLGDGAGGVASRTEYMTGGSPGDLDAADFNGDGVLDLAVVDRDNGIVVLLVGSTF